MGTYVLIFIRSFAVTVLQLVFKLVDTRYDMLIALLFPLFKIIPLVISARDTLSSAYDFKNHVTNEQGVSQGKLISYYRLYSTFR